MEKDFPVVTGGTLTCDVSPVPPNPFQGQDQKHKFIVVCEMAVSR